MKTGANIWKYCFSSLLATCFGIVPPSLLAQDKQRTQTSARVTDATEAPDIIVTGIRASLESAQRAKKDALQVLDAISAEDIGKFPDKNIGEALQRVTGVQISRINGEGAGVSIRGAGADLNRVEINGVTALGTGATRSVDFRDLPVEFVNRLEVVKSATPDMTEGGLGGTVRVLTRRPFDTKDNGFLAGSAQTIWSDLSNTFDPKIALIGSKKFANDTIGVLLSATWERRQIETHEARTTGWRQIDRDPATAGMQAYDLDGNGVGDFFPDIPRYVINRLDTKRYALNGVVEWRPSDAFKAYVEGTYSKMDQKSDSDYLQVYTNGATLDVANSEIGPDNTASRAAFLKNGALPQIENRTILGDINRINYNIAGGADFESDHWKIGGKASYSYIKQNNDYVNAVADVYGANGVTIDYDNPQHALKIEGVNLTSSDDINYIQTQHRPIVNVQDELAGKIDAEYRDLATFLPSIKIGGQYRRTMMNNRQWDRSVILNGYTNPALVPTIQNFTDLMRVGSGTPYFATGDIGYAGGANWIRPNQQFADAVGVPDPYNNPTLLETWDVVEKNWAGYMQAGFKFDAGLPVRGTIGARVVHTKTASDGYQSAGGVLTPITFYGKNTEFLPSFNLQADIIPDKLLFRGAATEVMARPSPAQLAPRLSLDIVGFTGSRGNPQLQPFRARQYDAGVEYYINRVSFLSATYFRKEISSFIQNVTRAEDINGVNYSITRPENGSEKVVVNGVEAGAQIAFDFLPGPFLNHLGVLANYTYAKDSGYRGKDLFTGEALPFPGLSRNSYNLAAYYEDDIFSVRASYNWRSDYLITPVGRGNNPEFGEPFGTLDVSGSINFNAKVSAFVEAVNILDATRVENANSVYRRTVLETYGPRVYAGIRFRM
ncbi:TonB-dependent receptor [Sphingobium sp. AP50]|uniref:TonB-dependent receptor n=1 Tax=Sphingobium sp. AP50 TaxID=1884369 RepID=UPI0008B7003B|nr:TonB-dependent receptor [Sphingobium sp. AP50]SEK00526.1 TonB-dependent receptor [Sphingobium sp. AP50]